MATYEAVKYSFVGSAITAIQSPNIADGSVTNTEFQHLDGTMSDIQTQLNAKFGSAGGTFTGNVTLNDNVHLFIGTGGATDLDLYHDGSNSYIKNSTGNLNLNSDSIVARDDGNTLNMFNASSTGAFNAYHNNSLRFATTSGGSQVTGELVATGDVTSQANVNGNGQNLTNLNATNLASGTLPMARLSGTLPALNGSALTNLNGSNVSSGTLPMARLSGTLPALNGSALTNLNASNLASGTVPSARLPAVALTSVVKQVSISVSAANFSSTTTIPFDSSLPTSSEGIQVMTRNFTPTASNSRLLHVLQTAVTNASQGGTIIWSIFNGNTNIGAFANTTGTAAIWNLVTGQALESSSGSTSAREYKCRFGPNTSRGHWLQTNNYAYNLTSKATWTIYELEP